MKRALSLAALAVGTVASIATSQMGQMAIGETGELPLPVSLEEPTFDQSFQVDSTGREGTESLPWEQYVRVMVGARLVAPDGVELPTGPATLNVYLAREGEETAEPLLVMPLGEEDAFDVAHLDGLFEGCESYPTCSDRYHLEMELVSKDALLSEGVELEGSYWVTALTESDPNDEEAAVITEVSLSFDEADVEE